MLASSFSLTLVIIQTLMNPFLFLPLEHKFWGPQVNSVAEGFEAVAEFVISDKASLSGGFLR
jgi:hypothetical protein